MSPNPDTESHLRECGVCGFSLRHSLQEQTDLEGGGRQRKGEGGESQREKLN